MLPRPHRMTRPADFTLALRGRRAAGRLVVVHQRLDAAATAPIVGLIVSRAVGGSVVRHRVSRRLRAQLTQRLTALPPASHTVVRALPASAGAASAELGADLDRALGRLRRPR